MENWSVSEYATIRQTVMQAIHFTEGIATVACYFMFKNATVFSECISFWIIVSKEMIQKGKQFLT